jgi:hypothetical protein
MIIPEPFATTLSITSTILINIASDIIEYHAKDLEGTLAGRLLKWSGLVEPDFYDRLRDTIKKALELFFQTYPQYDQSGIESFFRDPAVARQIGAYILNRQPIDEQQIQQALDRHLKKDAITVMLMQKRKVVPQNIIPDFMKCYRRVLNLQLSVPEMSILLEVLDQNDKVLTQIRASEARMKEFIAELLKTRLSPQALQAAYQAGQKEVALDLTRQMEAAKLVQLDEAAATIQKRLHSLPTLFTEGLCRGRVLEAASQQYFVSHGFAPDILVDWRKTLTETLAQASDTVGTLMPYFAGDTLMGGYRFCGICEKLYATRFSIFLLPPSQDRNVYLELGIAIGMRAPFLLIQARGAKMPPILEALSRYISNGTFRTLRQELPGKIGKIEEYDFAVVRPIKDPPVGGSQLKYLLATGNLIDDLDVEGSVVDAISARYPRLEAISLAQQTETASTAWMIEQLVDTIQSTRFAIYRVNQDCSATTFLALGISIAHNRPFLMICEAGSAVPADLRGIGMYQFPNFVTLEKDLIAQHQAFFEKHAQ